MITALAIVALLQPPAGEAAPLSPEPVCLTNACGPELKLAVDPAAVRAAVLAGEPVKVFELGGTADETMQAAKTRHEQSRRPEQTYNPAFGFDRFADVSDGSTFVRRPPADISTPPGITVVGGIERRYPDGRTEHMHLLSDGRHLNQARAPGP